MSMFNLTDVTTAGTFVQAMEAARESDRRTAAQRCQAEESRGTLNGLRVLARCIALAAGALRRDRPQVTSHPV